MCDKIYISSFVGQLYKFQPKVDSFLDISKIFFNLCFLESFDLIFLLVVDVYFTSLLLIYFICNLFDFLFHTGFFGLLSNGATLTTRRIKTFCV